MVDILLATYNGGLFLREQIDSILNQSFQKWRLIVSDDGSIDDTLSILSEYCTRFPSKIILVNSKINLKSAKNNFWSLINYSDAKYIMFCDQDDIWLEHKIEQTLIAMKDGESKFGEIPLLVHTDLMVINKEGQLISKSLYHMQHVDPKGFCSFKQLLTQNAVTGCTIMLNKSLKEVLVPLDDNVIMHDWWIALHAAYYGHIIYLEEANILYRQHQNNTIGAKKVNSVGYIVKKLINYEGIHSNISATYKQAESFYCGIGKSERIIESKYSLVNKYAELSHKPKLIRMFYIVRYGFWKQKMRRKIGQFLFC